MNHFILSPVGDQFGRHELVAAVMLSIAVFSLVQMRSVWPSWAWSVRASFDS